MTSSITNMSPTDKDIRLSKLLSKILRHKAADYGLHIDSNGLISIRDLLNLNVLKSQKITREDIDRCVENNNKKRFKIVVDESGNDLICAVQGHSIKQVCETPNMVQLSGQEWPQLIVHGTTLKNWELIQQSGGLSKMNRNHIHFTSTLSKQIYDRIPLLERADLEPMEGGSITGIRYNCEVLIILDIEKLKASNLSFFRSENNVILSPGDETGFISLSFVKKVVKLKQ